MSKRPTKKSKKERIDKLLVERNLVSTRSKAQALIMAGEVFVSGERIDKAGTKVPIDAELSVKEPLPYASRGGFKLAGALEQFSIDVTGMICADVGACTGGFTDVLLQSGADHVYSIDVGYGQLAWHLRQNPRVTVLERTNVRYLDELEQPIDFACIDVSFISLKLILPAVQKWLKPSFNIIALIKPQFEAGKKAVGKGGIVKDPDVHQTVLNDILNWAGNAGFGIGGLVQSSITGTEGNVEFLVWLKTKEEENDSLISLIDPLFEASETAESATETPTAD